MEMLSSILTRQQIAVAAAYWWDGLTQREIAKKFGIRRPAVTRKLARASAKLAAAGITPPRGRARPTYTKCAAQLSTVPAFLIP